MILSRVLMFLNFLDWSFGLDLRRFGDGSIVGQLLANAKMYDSSKFEERCGVVTYISPYTGKPSSEATDAKLQSYCSFHLTTRAKREPVSVGTCVVVCIAFAGTLVGTQWYNNDQYNKLEAARLKDRETHQLEERKQLRIQEEQRIINDVAEYNEWLEELFLHRRFVGSQSLKMVPTSLWKTFGLDPSRYQHAIADLTHTPLECSNNSVTVRVCYQTNPTMRRGELFRVHHIGAFTNQGQVFRYHKTPKYVFANGNDTHFIDSCSLVKAEYMCPQDNGSCNVDSIETCPIDSVPANASFTLVRSLSYTDIVATRIHNYHITNDTTSIAHPVPQDGILLLTLPHGTHALIGKVVLQGRHTEHFQVRLQPSNMSALQAEDIGILEELLDKDDKDIAELRKVVTEGWFEKLLRQVFPSLLPHVYTAIAIVFLLVALVLFAYCFFQLKFSSYANKRFGRS